MSNAYAFRPPPQMQQQMQQQAQPQQVGAALMGGQQAMRAPPDPDAELRREGARLMTTAQTTDGDAATLAAIGEALTRSGGGYTTNTSESAQFKDRARSARDLQRLGLSAAEAELLQMTGGA